MTAPSFKSISGKVTLDRSLMDIRVFSNLPVYPLLKDASLSRYTSFNFGYLRLSLFKHPGGLGFLTNATSANKTIVFKRASSVIGNFTVHATFDKILTHRILLWSAEIQTSRELKALKAKLRTDWDLNLRTYALVNFPQHRPEIFRLEDELKVLHLAFARLAAKLHVMSGSQDYGYLSDNVKRELINSINPRKTK